MKRWIRAIILLTLSFLSLTSLHAREFLELTPLKEAAALATPEKYPNSDDVLLDNYIQVRYQPDGSSETWDDTAIKVLTEKGKRENRTLTLHFNVSYGTNTYISVQVIKPNGSVQNIDIAAQSKIMVDPSQMSANIYNPNQKLVQLSVPDLEVGDILRYISHENRTKAIVPNAWSDYQVFEYTAPILHLTYEVIAPRERPLKKIALKGEIPGTVTHETKELEHTIVYSWNVHNVPRMFDEPNMPTRYTVVQRLLVSTLDSWKELSSWYWNLCQPRLAATTPEMETKVHELIAGKTTPREKIDAIFNFVSQEIRYMGITTEEEAPGYEPHDVKTTFQNRYGVCRDKAALLAAMLRMAHIEAFPVIIMAGPKKDAEVPQPFFNHAVTAALGDDGAYILMDSTDENTKDIFPSYLQDMSYIVARPEGETLLTSPLIPAENNLLHINTSGALDEDGNLTASSQLVFEGVNDTIYRGYFSKIKPEERQRFFEGHLKKGMPTAQLTKLTILPKELRDTTQPLTIRLQFTADNMLICGQQQNMLEMPRLGRSLGYANFLIGQTGLKKRKYPLYTQITAGIDEQINLTLPIHSGTVKIPSYQSVNTPQLTSSQTLKQTDNTLNYSANLALHTVEFSPEAYLTLKQNLKQMEYDNRKKVIFEKTPAAAPLRVAPDIHILSQSNHVSLTDASTWVETIDKRFKVLTYAGTKSQAELKFSYNPAWQEIELVRATVTQPDGTIKNISKEEINVMDAPWVASAPRYPAERILVANLPAVDVGSVVDYQIRSTVKGKPFFSTIKTFNGFNPIDEKTVTLTTPLSLELRTLNTGIPETKTISANRLTYTWTATNQPALKKEEQLPAWWTFNPALFISTTDWRSYANQLRTVLLTASQDQPQTAKKAQELIQGLENNREKIRALRNWVAMNIRAAGPALPQLPLSAITPADQTVNDGYGNNTDRAIVLYTLLQAAGFEPAFTLSGNISLIKEEADPRLHVPDRNAFSTVLVKLQEENETLYLTGDSQYAELGASPYNRRPALELSTGNLGTVIVPPGKANQSNTSLHMTLHADGRADIEQTALYHGTAFEGFHRLYAEITPEKRRRHALEMVAAISQSAAATAPLETDYNTYPGQLNLKVQAERYAVQDDAYLYFTLPGGLGHILSYRASEREKPLAWQNYTDRTFTYHITIPEGYTPVLLPQNFTWQAPNAAGLLSVTIETSGSTIRITQKATLKPAILPPSDYPTVLEAGRKLAHPNMRTLLLKKTH